MAKRIKTREEIAAEVARNERVEKAQAEARAALAANKCPCCGRGVRLNLSITGWVQCDQFGAPGFRKDRNAPGCDWQGFTR